jgi:glutamate/tyrosine decarboxylase-like PLP-dependent enzyme
LTGSAGGRFFAWVIGGVVPAALAADWLTSTWDQNAGMYRVSPAAAVVEEACGRWLLDLLALPEHCSFALVTGCQMAHVTCLAAARNALLAKRGWDVEAKGLYGAPPVRVLTSDQRHGTIERALRLLGMGRDCVVDIPVDAAGKLPAGALERELAASPDTATIVLLQAGDLNTGTFDPFEELIPIARAHAAWVHVDGAFGLWATTSPAHRHLLAGVDRADSWATDGHKWLNVPYDCGYAIVSDRDAHYRSLAHKASYLSHSTIARDQVDWTPEYSRRGRGFATYAAIASLGREGIGDIVARSCGHARAIVQGVAALPGVEVLHMPVINQGLVRFLDATPGAREEDHDRRTEEVTTRVAASGEALFACTTWRAKRCMRVSVSGWQTDESDVERAVRAIAACL